MTTSRQLDGHCPEISHWFSKSASFCLVLRGSAAMALGEVLSAPTPVLGGECEGGSPQVFGRQRRQAAVKMPSWRDERSTTLLP